MQQTDTASRSDEFVYRARFEPFRTADRMSVLSRAKAPLSALLRTSLANALMTPLVSPRSVDDYLALVDPCWSLTKIRARVVGVRRETPDVSSLLLQPNDNWRGHVAGQHVQLTVNVDGVAQTRSFTLSDAPRTGKPLRVTIKAHAGGCVSRWARERAQVGDVVTLSAAAGEFVLPSPAPETLLFVSGGSGLTPLVAMAQQLVRDGYSGALTWLHYDRSEMPLEQEVRALLSRLPNPTLHVKLTGDTPTPDALLSAAQLQQLVPDWRSREVFMCGPRSLMTTMDSIATEQGRGDHLHREHFQAVWKVDPSVKPGAHRHLVFSRSGTQCDARPGVSLLEQAEHAGLRPLHGCRMGICHTCTCKKHSGTVRNEITGQVSDARDEEIQLCIHTPLSDVSLDL